MPNQPLNPEIVRSIVIDDCDVTLPELLGSRRAARIVFARSVIAVVLRDHTGLSYPEIGKVLGKTHSSIVQAEKRLRSGEHDREAAKVTGLEVTAMDYSSHIWIRADEKSKVQHDDLARFWRLGDGPGRGAA